MSVTINVMDDATPMLQRLAYALKPSVMNPLIGQSASNMTKDHLWSLDRTSPNKLNGPRQHFYSMCAKSTHWVNNGDSVCVSISHRGAALRYYGGRVSAGKNISRWSGKPTRFLTIPACAAAYGHFASDFHNLMFAKVDGQPALVETQATRIKFGKKGVKSKGEVGGKVMYWLARKVKIPEFPGMIPSKQEYHDGIGRTIQSYCVRQVERKK